MTTDFEPCLGHHAELSKPMTVSRKSSLEERQAALYQIYQQVLERQPYHFERQRLAKAEKEFLADKIGVRRFLKELGHSEVYLNTFYYSASNLKFLEWCFKHFMGRAPIDSEELRFYCDILMKQGVQHLITAILDSEEYRKAFGCFTVPYPRVVNHYASPKAYWESHILNEEYVQQRGHILPTLYWHQLGLNCDAGVCRHLEAPDSLQASAITSAMTATVIPTAPLTAPPTVSSVLQEQPLQDNLLELLQSMDLEQARQIVASLSPGQKAALRKAMHQ